MGREKVSGMAKIEFFFDCSSPWTYLAFSRIHGVIERTQCQVHWKPILVGGVFNAVNQTVYDRRAAPDPVQGPYYVKDLRDWARYCGVKIGQPPVFPVRAVESMRGAYVALEQDLLVPYAQAVFESYWGELQDISKPSILQSICDRVGLNSASFFERIESPDIKERLRATTQELIDRGGFGSPTMFVNETDMYFGNDRLPLVEYALKEYS